MPVSDTNEKMQIQNHYLANSEITKLSIQQIQLAFQGKLKVKRFNTFHKIITK